MRTVAFAQSTQTATTAPAWQQTFNADQYLLGDALGSRRWLFDHGLTILPTATIDDSKNTRGGLDTAGNSLRQRYDIALNVDTEKLLGLHGGTIYTDYQFEHGKNASLTLTGDAQQITNATNADGQSQLGVLFYQQVAGPFRFRGGKLDANSDFDTLDNGVEFLNNSFSTSPCMMLMPSFPFTAMGLEFFVEPTGTDHGVYAGAGVFDGSQARGVETGENGPRNFLRHGGNLFLISEAGYRYALHRGSADLPGKIATGAWFDTNPFMDVSGSRRTTGTGGAYATFDQILWRPQQPKRAGNSGLSAGASLSNITAEPNPAEEQEFPGGIALTSSISWADPLADRIDGNLLGGLEWTGAIPARPFDVTGIGTTVAHFSGAAQTRDPYELTVEAFYGIRVTQYISLKPDVQYVRHPNGAGTHNDGTPLRDAVVFTLRLAVAF
ncbi:MAG: carbohydrate porin [Phycisphaerae bacterium]|nr:carbohydrate porin [Phycisphaerae bacterium]